MSSSALPFLARFRGRLRESAIWFILLAILVGVAAGALTWAQALVAHGLQVRLFGFDESARLSAQATLPLQTLIWLPVGGALLGLSMWALARWRPRQLVDVVEANALYGGLVSVRDSVIVCVQTILSNGFGASVGLEAAYAQAGGAAGSTLGQWLNLRRHDLRTLVGAGSGAAIGAAFGAPLTGAFYAFEIVLAAYSPSMMAPVAAACLAATLTANALGAAPYSIEIAVRGAPVAADYLLYAGLGAVCAIFGIALMRLIATAERLLRRTRTPPWFRPFLGGCAMMGLAAVTPQVLSSGHGALHENLSANLGMLGLLALILLKTVASTVSLAVGFRGGLFFASLFLGTLLGQLYAQLIALTGLPIVLAPESAALVGMGALAVAVVGGPLTMSFLVLECTRDFGIAAATLSASLLASAIVREYFGYSFSTWRLHLRGETIRSARDVGWIRSLTAGRMMRPDIPTISEKATMTEFRRRFPLGGAARVILLDDALHYAGIVQTPEAYVEGHAPEDAISTLAKNKDITLRPEDNIEKIVRLFDKHEAEELAVIGSDQQVLGLLAESYVSRRYARELEKVQAGFFGEN